MAATSLQKAFPFLEWIRDYRAEYLPRDLIAGLTVSVVLIPQAMSYAMIAGLPPIYGLYAACVPPIIAALWGKSSQLATGPVAIVSLLTFSSVLPYARPGTPEFITMAINLAAIVGTFQILMGLFKLGFIMRFVSHPVIVGFTNAGAIIIATTQVKHLLGIEVKDSEFIFPIFVDIVRNLTNVNVATLGIGVLALAIIYGGHKLHKDFPGAMVASVVTILMGYFLNVQEYGVKTIGEMPTGLPVISIPFMEYIHEIGALRKSGGDMISAMAQLESIFRLIGPGIIIAIVGFMESMAITKTIAAKTKQPVDLNQELIGQGAANLFGAFFRSYPVSGSFSRTAVIFQTGGRTALANVFSGIVVILTLLFFTGTFYHLPKATLAAIVIAAVVGLVRQRQFVKLYKTNRHDGIIALVTFAFALLTKPDYAIFIGIALSLLLFLWMSMSPRIIVLTRDPRAEIFVNAEAKKLPVCPQIMYIMPDFSIYFANAEFFREQVYEKAMQQKYRCAPDASGPSPTDERPQVQALKYILIDMEMVNRIDATGIDEMRELILDLKKEGIEIYLANLRAPVREVIENSGLRKYFPQDRWYMSKADAITRLFNLLDYDCCRNKCPHVVFWECETVKYPLCVTPAPEGEKDETDH